MKIWLPYANFRLTAKVLATEDLLDEIHDIERLLDTLHQTDKADDDLIDCELYRAWQGHETQLAELGINLCEEASNRRDAPKTKPQYKGCCSPGMGDHLSGLLYHQQAAESGGLSKPKWFGWTNLHTSHCAGLLAQGFDYYQAFFSPHIRIDQPIIWLPEWVENDG